MDSGVEQTQWTPTLEEVTVHDSKEWMNAQWWWCHVAFSSIFVLVFFGVDMQRKKWFLPKMWPQRSYNIYIYFFRQLICLCTQEQHRWCITNVFRSHLYNCFVVIVPSSSPLMFSLDILAGPEIPAFVTFSPLRNRYVLLFSFRWTRTCACVCLLLKLQSWSILC